MCNQVFNMNDEGLFLAAVTSRASAEVPCYKTATRAPHEPEGSIARKAFVRFAGINRAVLWGGRTQQAIQAACDVVQPPFNISSNLDCLFLQLMCAEN